jgi:hypothetical protein
LAVENTRKGTCFELLARLGADKGVVAVYLAIDHFALSFPVFEIFFFFFLLPILLLFFSYGFP